MRQRTEGRAPNPVNRERLTDALDATFARREHRELFAERFGKRNIAWRVLEAQVSNAAVKQRLRTREAKPDEVSDARLEDFGMLTRRYEPPVELAADQCVKAPTSGSLDQTVTKALQNLARIPAKQEASRLRTGACRRQCGNIPRVRTRDHRGASMKHLGRFCIGDGPATG